MNTHVARHLYYQQHLLPRIASAMGLTGQREYRDVDFVMFDGCNPAVEVEIENAPAHANEIVQLASSTAPLGVLVLTLRWHHTFQSCQRPRFVREVQSEVRQCCSELRRPGVLALIVGEWRSEDGDEGNEASGTISLYGRVYDRATGDLLYGRPDDGTGTADTHDKILFREHFECCDGKYRWCRRNV